MSLVGTILSSSEALNLAHQIAKAATCLDEMQAAPADSTLYIQYRKEAAHHAKTLHDIAQKLAGEYADQIYAPDDAPELMEGICCANIS